MKKTCFVVLAMSLSQLAVAGGDLYPTAECMRELSHDARLRVLDGKIALGASDETSLSQLALPRLPTAEEDAALAVLSQLRQDCFTLGAAHRAAAHAALPVLADRMFAAQQELLRELREERIGFAEFNARRLELWQVERSQQADLLRSDKFNKTSAALR
jgi:hypothetical protein